MVVPWSSRRVTRDPLRPGRSRGCGTRAALDRATAGRGSPPERGRCARPAARRLADAAAGSTPTAVGDGVVACVNTAACSGLSRSRWASISSTIIVASVTLPISPFSGLHPRAGRQSSGRSRRAPYRARSDLARRAGTARCRAARRCSALRSLPFAQSKPAGTIGDLEGLARTLAPVFRQMRLPPTTARLHFFAALASRRTCAPASSRSPAPAAMARSRGGDRESGQRPELAAAPVPPSRARACAALRPT